MTNDNHIETARMALEADDLDTVFALVNQALEEGDDRVEVMELLARAFLKAGMKAEAGEAYENAATRAGSEGFVHWKAAARAYDEAGEKDKTFVAAMKAQKLVDGDADIVYLLAREFHERGETELLQHFKNRLTASDDPQHLQFAAKLISSEGRNPFNLTLFKKLAMQNPDDHYTQFKLMGVAREFCDYETIARQEAWLAGQIERCGPSIFEGETAYSHLLHCCIEDWNRYSTNHVLLKSAPTPEITAFRRKRAHQWGERIRIGYFSNDFSSQHATMRLLRHVLELHDRERFDITLYCYTPDDLVARDDGGRAQWGRIVCVKDLGIEETVARMQADRIDVLVDLKGHTGNSRSHYLNQPVAPIHVEWLGFPGSAINVDADYVIGDATVLPDSSKPFYHEKFVRLPDSYQPNDNMHRPLPMATSRAELGLPWHKFVFASFNSNRKITLETIDLWAEILKRSPNSILWVMLYHDISRGNFRDYMAKKGIAADRIVFCDAADYAVHLARVQAADLCLDTFPYNGHTTTSDMLWAGVPVLTRKGTNFASRVSESLLRSAGLADLVAEDDEDFIRIASTYANEPLSIHPLKARVAASRNSVAFDSERFCRNLEKAYVTMAERAKAGLEPDHFDVR